jgi:hypothetical protein
MVAIDRLVLAGAPSAARTSVSHSKPQQPVDSQQGALSRPFASGPVGMHSSPPLIGMYRSLPSSNRPDSISLVRFLTVSPLWCMACGGFLAMSTIEFAEELNQPRHRFSNTGAMTAETAELAFVRHHSCASEFGSPRRAGDLSANALGSQRSCDRRAAADLLQSTSRTLPVPPHDPTKHFSMEARRLSSLA